MPAARHRSRAHSLDERANRPTRPTSALQRLPSGPFARSACERTGRLRIGTLGVPPGDGPTARTSQRETCEPHGADRHGDRLRGGRRARALEATGRDVIHLEIGEPDFDTPRHVSEAAARALLDEGATHYTAATGIAPLREAIAADVKRWKGIETTPEQVVVTPGAKPIMFYAMLALVDDGDEVIYPNPGFPIYESMARYVGGTPVAAPLREENDFRMDVDEVASLITPRTRLLVFNSPHNPTGSVLTHEDIERLAELALEHDLVVLADEIYGRLQYEGEPLSIATLPGMAERTITLDGFSKTFAMTGWRLGYGILPEWLVPAFSRLIINSVSCTNAFAQHGAIEALTGPQDEADAYRTEFIARRSLMVDGLNAIAGISCRMPHGAFYAFPNVASFGRTSAEIADHLLYDAGVCGLAGTAFGQHGEGYLRFSYANSRENLARWPLERVGESLAKLERTGRNLVAPVTGGQRQRWSMPEAARPRHPDHPRRRARPRPRGVRGRPVGGRAAPAARRAAAARRTASTACSRCSPTASTTSCSTRPARSSRWSATSPSASTTSTCRPAPGAGSPVGNTPGVLTETTADLAFALLMAAARRIPEGVDYVRAGSWKTWGPMLLMGVDLHGATLGIVGFGRIGREMARRGGGFGMRILYHDVNPATPEEEAELGARRVDMDELLAGVRLRQPARQPDR